MVRKPRFTLKAILGCTAAVSVPLAVAATGEPMGLLLLPFIGGHCVGYLVDGQEGACVGVFVGALVMLALTLAMVPS